MVGDNAQRTIARAVDVGIGDVGGCRDQRLEQIDVVIVVDTLHDGGDALEAHAGVDGRTRQAGARTIRMLLELHEHEVPDFDPAIAVFIRRARRTAPDLVAMVVKDFRARTAGAGIAHLPEVGLGAEPHDTIFGNAGDLLPELERLVIVLIDGDHETVAGEPPVLGQKVPGEFNRFGLEIIAEGEIAQHFKEGVVARGEPNIVEVIVLAACAHAFLRGRRRGIGPLFDAGKDVLELHHAGIGEHQRRIVARHKRAGRHGFMAVTGKVIDKARAKIVYAGHQLAFMRNGHERALEENRGFLSCSEPECPALQQVGMGESAVRLTPSP